MRNEFEYDSYNAHKIKGHYKIFSKIKFHIYLGETHTNLTQVVG